MVTGDGVAPVLQFPATMRSRDGVVISLLLVVGSPRAAHATTESCAAGATASTGESAQEVLQHCGTPAASRHYPGAHGRYGYRQPEDVWTYDLGEGTFPRVLHFIGGILDSITLVSRSP